MLPTDLMASDLISAFRAKTLSPIEFWLQLETHIAAWEPHLNALYAYDPAAARQAAQQSTARWRQGTPIGPLDGVPVTVKELVATAGVPIPNGSAATRLRPAPVDAPPAARLREAGAILFAKTTAPDLAMLSSGLSSFHGITRNPWDLSRTPGGSSSGAGAAAAAGYGPLHLGTDIGGSIRLPAAWCGVVGFKPSFGRVPTLPYYVGRTAGPITRSVTDAALMMATLAWPDARDAMSLPWQEIDWAACRRPLPPQRIGLMLEPGCGLPVDAEILAVTVAAAERLAAAGHRVTAVAPLMTRSMLDGIDDFWRARAWNDLRLLSPRRRQRLLPAVRLWAEGAIRQPAWRAVQGFNQTIALRQAAAALFADIDLLLSPTAPVTAFAADLASPLNDPSQPFEHIVFTLPWNMSEQPALSLNGGVSGLGLPIGVQIVGPRFDDLRVLQLAHQLEQLLPPARPLPVPPPA
jgi:aspartyl-tRNA(Asn)/glutamyl-tRNA(Gln) amidotransferase subunit A